MLFRHASRYAVASAAIVGSSMLYQHQAARCEAINGTPAAAVSTKAKIEKIHNIEHILEQYRPDISQYERVDHVIFEEDDLYKTWRDQHALYTSLHGESRIEAYEIYRSKTAEEIYCVLKFGDKINGWPDIVHGGITALILDNTYGWLFTTFKKPKAVTANLTVDYRSPIFANSCSILRAKIDRVEGKKLYMTATVEDADTHKIQAQSSTLFIFIK